MMNDMKERGYTSILRNNKVLTTQGEVERDEQLRYPADVVGGAGEFRSGSR